MEKAKTSWTKYVIPGFVFQQVVIGGGYGTGAEIAQFFGTQGLLGGFLAQMITMVVWTLMCVITFEFVRIFKTYDYGSLMKRLLGRGAILYEVCYWAMMVIIMGVVCASAGSMLNSLTGLSKWFGIGILSAGMVILVLKGTATIEKALTLWGYVLYAVYILFMVVVFYKFGGAIANEFARAEIGGDWWFNGLRYSFYNLVVVAVVLYTVRDLKTRKEAVLCGIISGIFGIIPAVLLLLVMGCNFTAAIQAEIPVAVVFEELNMLWLYILFESVLLGTLIATGTGFIKAVDDRVEIAYKRAKGYVPRWVRPAIAVGLTALGVVVSTFGLIPLIAQGYGIICWGFFLFFALPMLTIGLYKINSHDPDAEIEVEIYNEN